MFNFLQKKPRGEKIIFKIEGMHCVSCSMNIDGELEETEGVINSETNYARAKATITYDPTKTKPEKLKKVIESLGYSVAPMLTQPV